MSMTTYNQPPLVMTEDRITDRLGSQGLDELPDPQPADATQLTGTTPLIERLWRIALADIESNIQRTEHGEYFGAGAHFGVKIYTRDISYSGLLGLNQLFPQIMRQSLEVTRNVRRKLGFKVSRGHAVPAIEAPWEEQDMVEADFMASFHSNSYSRRTDDVVWLWAADDLIGRQPDSGEADWRWIYETGCTFFDEFYRYFHDPSDGLYRGQASFIDVMWPLRPRPVSGYPPEFTIEDCLLLKTASTNALYVKGMGVLAEMAAKLGLEADAASWRDRQSALKQAVQTHLVSPEGRIVYYLDRHGQQADRHEALGTALCILHDVVDAEIARTSIEAYPQTDIGIPIFDPFFPTDQMYHNNASWPFVDAFFLAAAEKAIGDSRAAYNLALLARTVSDDGFHELVDMRSGEIAGSGHQLWTAAAYIDACRRAGLLNGGPSHG